MDDGILEADVVNHVCAFVELPALARIELSKPFADSGALRAWLRVERKDPNLVSLCDLYRRRLLTPEAIIQALGGFVSSPEFGDLIGDVL